MTVGAEVLERGIECSTVSSSTPCRTSELHELTIVTQRLGDRLAAVSASIVARWDASGVWAGDGSRAAGRGWPASRRRPSARPMPRCAAPGARDDARDVCGGAGRRPLDRPGRSADRRKRRQAARRVPRARAVPDRPHQGSPLPARAADAVLLVSSSRCRARARRRHRRTAGRHGAPARSETLDGMVAIDGLLDPVGGAIVTGSSTGSSSSSVSATQRAVSIARCRSSSGGAGGDGAPVGGDARHGAVLRRCSR